MSERDLEAPEADVAEQDTVVSDDGTETDAIAAGDVPVEVDPADRAEQQRSVSLGDDDYR